MTFHDTLQGVFLHGEAMLGRETGPPQALGIHTKELNAGLMLWGRSVALPFRLPGCARRFRWREIGPPPGLPRKRGRRLRTAGGMGSNQRPLVLVELIRDMVWNGPVGKRSVQVTSSNRRSITLSTSLILGPRFSSRGPSLTEYSAAERPLRPVFATL